MNSRVTRQSLGLAPSNGPVLLIAAVTSMAIATSLLLIVATGNTLGLNANPMLLLILAVLLAVVSLAAAFISMQLHGKRFDLFHPLFFAAWFFFLPQFVLSSLILVFGNTLAFPADLLSDPWGARVTALEFAILGAIGLSLGYFLPLGKRLGLALPRFTEFSLTTSQLRRSILFLLLLGLLAQIGAFGSGQFGYQFNVDVPLFGTTFATFAQVMIVVQGIIWFVFFRGSRGWWQWAFVAALILLVEAIVSGSRGALFNSLLVVMAAYQYAHERLTARMLARWAVIVLIALFAGFIFGSYFRIAKNVTLGRTASLSLDDVGSLLGETFDSIQQQSPQELVGFAWDRFIERIDAPTFLAVIVTSADPLKQTEADLGMDQNIWKDLATTFIPRFLWPDKPIVGIQEQIGNIYFGTQFNTPTVTYMGDLFRNFGVWGIVPGMLVIGIALRTIYVWLIERRPLSPLRVGLYMTLGFVVNYESLYSLYFPALIRTLFVALVVVLIIHVLKNHPRS